MPHARKRCRLRRTQARFERGRRPFYHACEEEKGVLPITPERYKRVLVYKKEGKASAVSAGITEGAADKLIEKLKAKGFDITVFVPGWRLGRAWLPPYRSFTTSTI